MTEALKLLGDLATTASLVALVAFVIQQVRLNRLLGKRIERLEMLLYWQGGDKQ